MTLFGCLSWVCNGQVLGISSWGEGIGVMEKIKNHTNEGFSQWLLRAFVNWLSHILKNITATAAATNG
jgi:isopentenyldiphosphate isomerase